jgi:hypothetical protein
VIDGAAWLGAGWPERAIRSLAAAAAADPIDAEAGALLAEAIRRAGDPAGALDALERPWLALQDPTPALSAVRAAALADLRRESVPGVPGSPGGAP